MRQYLAVKVIHFGYLVSLLCLCIDNVVHGESVISAPLFKLSDKFPNSLMKSFSELSISQMFRSPRAGNKIGLPMGCTVFLHVSILGQFGHATWSLCGR